MKIAKYIVFTLVIIFKPFCGLLFAAEYPVYFESETEVKNLVNMKTAAKHWQLDTKTRRTDSVINVMGKSSNHTQIVTNGLIYDLEHATKNYRKTAWPREYPNSDAHAFTVEELNRAGMKLIGNEQFEGQDCEIYAGNIVKKVVENNPSTQADINKIQAQGEKVGLPKNLLNQYSSIFWIRKSDRRLIRHQMKIGANASSEIIYRKISTEGKLFDKTLFELPSGYSEKIK
jgi:hypothetical protein